ncbi:hypothetical protein L2E82_07512 [Cichorium intybus]|uniref:Uncharacterized protein n=1 Tax=Cichorium intybus TaxID=13427 RepID=A0ACB9G515_CICIN|nr:hypothetical protein L2E82_07512 [Cichorium intybus]
MKKNITGVLKVKDASSQGGRSDTLFGTTEITQSGSTPVDEPSTLTMCVSWKPDFSKLKWEICLDNLSVRELHATFKATFGRETSVKDKQWLKRRIYMGLSNSCDVSTTTFIIENNTIIKKPKVEDHNDDNKEPLVGLEGTNGSSDNISDGQSQTLQMTDDLGGNSKSVQNESANTPKNQNQFTSEDDNQG